MRPSRLLAALLAASLLAGCATRPPADDPQTLWLRSQQGVAPLKRKR